MQIENADKTREIKQQKESIPVICYVSEATYQII